MSVVPIDRKKHYVDVMERVLGPARDSADMHTDMVSLEERPWLAGTTTSAVEVRVGGVTGRLAHEPQPRARKDLPHVAKRRTHHHRP